MGSCQAYWWYYGFGGYVLLVPFISLIFFFRVGALYGNSWQMIIFLFVMFSVEFVGEIVTTVHVTIPDARNAINASISSDGLPDCDTKIWLDPRANTFQTLAWAPFLTNSGLLFFLTLYKLWEPLKIQREIHRTSYPSDFKFKSPIVSSMFKDGILYFFIVFVSGGLLMLRDLIPSMRVFGGYFHLWFIMILSLTGARLILNLRRIAANDFPGGSFANTHIVFNTFAARNTSWAESISYSIDSEA